MKLIYKINLAVIGLLAVSALLVGAFFFASFRDLRAETYRWFDASARNLAFTIGNQVKDSLAYFDYTAIEVALRKRLADDRNLLFASVAFGEGLKERREAGAVAAGPFRSADVEIKDDTKTIATVTIHYATSGVESKLSTLVFRLVLGLGLTLVGLVALLSFFVVRFVSRPLGLLVRHAETTAAGDLTSTITIASNDEFGILAGALNRMNANLLGMFEKVGAAFGDLEVVSRDIAEVSHRIAEGGAGQTTAVATVSSSIEQMNASIKSVVQSVEHLFSLAGESSSSMLEMSASVEQVAGNAEGLSNAVESTSASITEMTLSIRNVAENVGRLADLVTNTSSSITEIDSVVREIERNAGQGHELTREVDRMMREEGLAALRRTAEGMVAIRGSVSQAATVVRGLEARSHEIGSILGVINEVNDQTNLLALNAAILAAQAGEHGRGFAVVAEEIRELSARTASSTKEITKLIASVKQESTHAVEAMEDGTLKVEEGARTVEELGETIRRAAENSEKASGASRGIAQATTEQYKGIRQIAASSQTINEMAQEIARATREQSTGGAQIIKAAEAMRELAHQVKRAMSEQAKGIRVTSRASEESARLSQQVLNAAREEARGSDLVVNSIGSIQEVSNANAAGVKRLDQMVNILAAQAELLKAELARFKIR
ncbi:MAG: methyl-accepting chemotaxis protein [Candidatus Methylomirabilia bacterium]